MQPLGTGLRCEREEYRGQGFIGLLDGPNPCLPGGGPHEFLVGAYIGQAGGIGLPFLQGLDGFAQEFSAVAVGHGLEDDEPAGIEVVLQGLAFFITWLEGTATAIRSTGSSAKWSISSGRDTVL